MSELGHAVEAMINLLFLIEENAENPAEVRRLTELARAPMLSLIARVRTEE